MNDMTDLKPRQRVLIFTLVDDHMYVRYVHMATCSVSTQTNLDLKGMSDIGDSIVEDRGSTKRRLLMEDVLKNDKSCKFYTGKYTFKYSNYLLQCVFYEY